MNFNTKEIVSIDSRVLTFRNSVFPPLEKEMWRLLDNKGILIEHDNNIKGILPMQERSFKIDNDLFIPVLNENNVCVDPNSRGESLGSKLLKYAYEVYKDNYPAFNVFRFDESSKAYGFYRKNDHCDLCFKSLYSLDIKFQTSKNVLKLNKNDFLQYEKEVTKLFKTTYNNYSGYNFRDDSYYSRVIENHIYKNDDWQYFVYFMENKILGYLIINPKCELIGESLIYDISYESIDIMVELIQSSMEYNNKLNFFINNETPSFEELINMGFKYQYETSFLLSKVINIKKLFFMHIDKDLFPEGLVIKIPKKTYKVITGSNPITLTMKSSVLTRLLFKRVDFLGLLSIGLIRLSRYKKEEIEYLSQTFRYNRWFIPAIDFI